MIEAHVKHDFNAGVWDEYVTFFALETLEGFGGTVWLLRFRRVRKTLDGLADAWSFRIVSSCRIPSAKEGVASNTRVGGNIIAIVTARDRAERCHVTHAVTSRGIQDLRGGTDRTSTHIS